jgi:hypothetical protein
VTYHKFNGNFKSHINFEETGGIQRKLVRSITLTILLGTNYEFSHIFFLKKKRNCETNIINSIIIVLNRQEKCMLGPCNSFSIGCTTVELFEVLINN